MPIRSGANSLTVYASDRAGNETQLQPLTVTPSTVQLVMNPIQITPAGRQVTLTGTVSTDQSVSVNGVAATVTGGTWTATVPIPGDERLFVLATATSSGVQTAATSAGVVRHPRSFVGKYSLYCHWVTDHPTLAWKEITQTFNWEGDVDDISASFGVAVVEDTSQANEVKRQVITWEKNKLYGDLRVYQDNALVNTDLNSQFRPPSSDWQVLPEQCNVKKNGKMLGLYNYKWQRTVKSTLKVFTGSRPQNREKWFLTLERDGGTWNGHFADNEDPEMGGRYWRPWSWVPPDDRDLTIGGRKVYPCDGVVFEMYAKEKNVDVTPKLKGSRWYEIGVNPAWPPLYAMTRAYHPDCSGRRAYLQGKFDDAARLLGIDDDSWTCGGGDADDVPYYADFYISNDKNPTEFSNDMWGDEFNNVNSRTLHDVRCWEGAHIKQVHSLPRSTLRPGYAVLGDGLQGSFGVPAIIFALSGRVSPTVVAHEWAHTRNLEPYRDTSCPEGDDCHVCDSTRSGSALMSWLSGPFNHEININEATSLRFHEDDRPPEP